MQTLIKKIGLMLCLFSVLAVGSFAQMSEGLKRNEKVRQKVAQLGTGAKTMVQVELYDGKIYWGHITDANDKTFTVVDDKNLTRTADYGDVKKVGTYKKMSTKSKVILGSILAGVGTAIVVLVSSVFRED